MRDFRPPVTAINREVLAMSTDADSATTRREVLQRAAAVGLVVGGVGSLGIEQRVRGDSQPKRGGTLRVGLPGGPAATDNLDPHLEGVAGFAQAYRQIVYSKLTDMRPNGASAGSSPSL